MSYKLIASFCWTNTNSIDLGQTPENKASGQGIHCLLTEYSIKYEYNKTIPAISALRFENNSK